MQVCDNYYPKCALANSNDLFQAISKTSQWYWSDRDRHRVGRNNLDNARREIVNLALEEIGVNDLPLAHKIANAFIKLREEMITLFPHARETLEHLRNDNIALALMTNGESEKQRVKIKRFDLEKYFDAILVEGEIGYGKPDKEVYTMALDALLLNPEDVWAVGDNLEWDVWGPQQLGIYGIWNDHKAQGLPPSSEIVPDRVINNISELIE
jgi:putative hydrolase of the HAD superfamily